MVYRTANFLFLVPTTALTYISKERRCNDGLRGVEHFKIEEVIIKLRRFSGCQLNASSRHNYMG